MTGTVLTLLVGGIGSFIAFHTGDNPLLAWALGAIIIYWLVSAPPWLHEFKSGWLEFEPGETALAGDVRIQGFHVRYRGVPMGFVYYVAVGWRGTLGWHGTRGNFKTPADL